MSVSGVLTGVTLWLVHAVYALGNGDYYEHQTFRRNNGHPIGHNQTSACSGLLRPPCVCTEVEVKCINAQFTDTDVFLNINTVHFRFLTRVTFQGNNFRYLPKAVFGHGFNHTRLVMLNLSSNYIVRLDENALMGVPKLQTLDMKDNEIMLFGNETNFFTHTPHLRSLYLRRAFNPNVNQKLLTEYLERMFAAGRLQELRELDLSLNGLAQLPRRLGCYFPNLRTLDLSINRLTTLDLDGSCFKHLDSLSVRYNKFTTLSLSLRMTASQMPDYSLRVADNRYLCDCNAHAYISWLRATNKIQDRDQLRCFRASPAEFDNASLMEVQIDGLDCSKNLTSGVGVLLSRQFIGFDRSLFTSSFMSVSSTAAMLWLVRTLLLA